MKLYGDVTKTTPFSLKKLYRLQGAKQEILLSSPGAEKVELLKDNVQGDYPILVLITRPFRDQQVPCLYNEDGVSLVRNQNLFITETQKWLSNAEVIRFYEHHYNMGNISEEESKEVISFLHSILHKHWDKENGKELFLEEVSLSKNPILEEYTRFGKKVYEYIFEYHGGWIAE